jgi:chromosome segregation ATPase
MQILHILMKEMDSAAGRLDAALKRLEVALDAHLNRAGDPAALRAEIAALVSDRSRLAAELDETLAREQELQQLADAASDALGAAIQEVRAALGPEEKEPGDGQG